jgi:hypothetical protein
LFIPSPRFIFFFWWLRRRTSYSTILAGNAYVLMSAWAAAGPHYGARATYLLHIRFGTALAHVTSPARSARRAGERAASDIGLAVGRPALHDAKQRHAAWDMTSVRRQILTFG